MAANLPFTEDDLRRAAGPASFGRGLGYLDQVADLEFTGAWATATVFGNDEHEVRLRFGDSGQGVSGTCSCPFGAEGNFCKHCVATGLAALKTGDFVGPAGADPDPDEHPLIAWLGSLSKDELFGELLELIVEVPAAADHLQLRAAAEQTDIEGVREAVKKLIWITDYAGYREAGAYAGTGGGRDRRLIDAGAGDDAIDVARDAISWLGQCSEMVDDSSGDIGDAASELLHVHLLACQAAPPDPVELAGYLAGLYLTRAYPFMPALAGYAELLGAAGTAALRERVAAAYEANPDDYHVQFVMESVIEATGDVDALVAFYTAQLDESGWHHLRIARVPACHEALGTMDKFRQYMVLLRMGQKRKRNLMSILEQNGL